MYRPVRPPHVIGEVPGLPQAIEQSQPARSASAAPAPVQPTWERHLKRALAVVVAGCTATVPFLSPVSDEFAFKVCGVIIGFGAALGITSSGNRPK